MMDWSTFVVGLIPSLVRSGAAVIGEAKLAGSDLGETISLWEWKKFGLTLLRTGLLYAAGTGIVFVAGWDNLELVEYVVAGAALSADLLINAFLKKKAKSASTKKK